MKGVVLINDPSELVYNPIPNEIFWDYELIHTQESPCPPPPSACAITPWLWSCRAPHCVPSLLSFHWFCPSRNTGNLPVSLFFCAGGMLSSGNLSPAGFIPCELSLGSHLCISPLPSSVELAGRWELPSGSLWKLGNGGWMGGGLCRAARKEQFDFSQ